MKRKESARRRRRFLASTRSLARRRLASRDLPLPVSGFGDSPSHRGRFRHSPSIRGCFRRSTASVVVVFVDAALLSCFLSFKRKSSHHQDRWKGVIGPAQKTYFSYTFFFGFN